MKFNLDTPVLIGALLSDGLERVCIVAIVIVISVRLILAGWRHRSEHVSRLLLAVSALSFLGAFIATARILLFMARHSDAAMQWNPVVKVAYAFITYASLAVLPLSGWILLECRNRGCSAHALQVPACKLAESQR